MKKQFDKLVERDSERIDKAVEAVKKYVLYEQFHDASKKFNLGILQKEINEYDAQSEIKKKYNDQMLQWKVSLKYTLTLYDSLRM